MDYFYGAKERKRRQALILGAAALFTSFITGGVNELQVLRLTDQIESVQKSLVANLNSVSHSFATFRDSITHNNEKIKLAICSSSKSELEILINEQKQLISLSYFDDLNYFRNGKVPAKLLSGLRKYCPLCNLPLTGVQLTDIGLLQYGKPGRQATNLVIMVELTLYQYNTYTDMVLIKLVNAGITIPSTFGNNKHIQIDVPTDIWVDGKSNTTYTGNACKKGMLSDTSLFCETLLPSDDCISNIIKFKNSKKCKFITDYVDFPCSYAAFDAIGIFCRGPKIIGSVTQSYIDKNKDLERNITSNCSIHNLEESTTIFNCDGRNIFTQNSMTTFFEIEDFNPKNILQVNISLEDFSKLSFTGLKEDIKSTFNSLTYREVLTVYVLSGTAIILTISLLVYFIKFRKCCRKRVHKIRQNSKVNIVRKNIFIRNGISNKSEIKRKLRNHKEMFNDFLTVVSNIDTTEFRSTRIHNIRILNKILTSIKDATDLVNLKSRFTSRKNVEGELENYLKELYSYNLYTNAVDLERTLLNIDIPCMDSSIIAEFKTLL